MPRLLSAAEAAFLLEKGIFHRWVYARPPGLDIHEALRQMRMHDKYVLHGFSPCTCGIALRSRKGDCLRCHPKQCERIASYTLPGYVYLLYSWDARLRPNDHLIKVGCTLKTAQARASDLNQKGYAVARDWLVFDYVNVSRPALMENQLKAMLSPYYVRVPFMSYGVSRYSSETYNCDILIAHQAMLDGKRNYLRRHRRTIEQLRLQT